MKNLNKIMPIIVLWAGVSYATSETISIDFTNSTASTSISLVGVTSMGCLGALTEPSPIPSGPKSYI